MSEVADEILSVSENIPYYLQAIAALTFEKAAEGDRKDIRPDDVEIAAQNFVGINSELYEERLSGLSDAKRAIIEALAKEPVNRVSDPFFTRYILKSAASVFT